ncbi:unnamed protein product, partial [Symbiodinium sp. CCMP2456]
MTQADLQMLQSFVEDDPVISSEGGASLLHALTREFHCNTWFVLQDDHEIVMTRRGTRPGGCLADAMFSLLFNRVLTRRGSFRENGWAPKIPWSGKRDLVECSDFENAPLQVDAQDIIYADDLATCIVTSEAASLPRAVAHIAGEALDSLAEFGLSANLGPRKTAVLLCPAGVGAKSVREQVFFRNKGKLMVLRENAVTLDSVSSYKHLGSCLTHNSSMLAEIRAKMGVAKAAFHEGQRLIFCSGQICLRRRTSLFRTHVLAGLLTGAGAWPLLCESSWKIFEQGIYNMYRRLLRVPRQASQKISRWRILSYLDMPSPQDLVHTERLRFLGQLVRSGPDAVGPHGPVLDNWDSWTSLIRQHPGQWKGYIKRAGTWHLNQAKAEADFFGCVRACWQPVPPRAVAVAASEHCCVPCKIAFADFQSWAAHAAKAHKYRLVRHLQMFPRCCQAVAHDVEGLLPPLIAPDGPVQSHGLAGYRMPDFPDLPPPEDDFCPALLAALHEAEVRSDSEVFALVQGVIEPFPLLRQTVRTWAQQTTDPQRRAWGEDVLLCMQVDLLCDRVSNAARVDDEDAAMCFTPMIEGCSLNPMAPPLPSLVVGRVPEAKVNGYRPLSSPTWIRKGFETEECDLGCFACVVVDFPLPCAACSPFWRAMS